MTDKPTEAQIKEFWEWCGFVEEYEAGTNAWWVKAPDSRGDVNYPPIDLNNLFKYAVPNWITGIEFSWGDEAHTTTICKVWYGIYAGLGQNTQQLRQDFYEAEGNTEALALFWALWQVKEKSNG